MTDEKPQKPVWMRHPGCQQLVFNEPLNINAHKLACPYDIKKTAQLLAERVEKLEGLLKSFTDAPAEAPQPALDSIGSWDEAEPAHDEAQEVVRPDLASTDEHGRPTYVSPPTAVEADGWDDDEESLGSVPIGR